MSRKNAAYLGFYILSFFIWISLPTFAQNRPEDVPSPYKDIESIALKGEIADDDNISFTAEFEVEFKEPGILPLISGDVCETMTELKPLSGSYFFGLFSGGEFKLRHDGTQYYIECVRAGKCGVKFGFVSGVKKLGNLRETSFGFPSATARSIEISSKRSDLEIKIDGALQADMKIKDDGGSAFTAVLPPDGQFHATWRGHAEKIDAELVASADSNIVATVYPGSVKLHNIFSYSVIQGKLKTLELKVPQDVNILNVKGENIQDWKIDQKDNAGTLVVSLSRECEKEYRLTVEAEKILKDFPCKFSLPSIAPQKILRLDGFLAFGTSGAIKLLIDKSAGLSQIDTASFPRVKDQHGQIMEIPKRSAFTYRFSSGDYVLETSADNIIPTYMVDLNYVVNFKDEDMYARAICSLDIKDAPLRELMVRYDGDMTVNRVEGPKVVPDDYELMEKDGAKWIKVPFVPDTMGRTELFINFERNIKAASDIKIPSFFIDKAKSVRGYLLLSAVRGLLVTVKEQENLRKVHVGSSPLREPGLQYAFRIKGQDWAAKVDVVHEKANIAAEIFNICSVGEGTLYGSSSFTYHITGAPVDKIAFVVNPAYKNIEFTGRNIVDWKRLGDEKDSQVWQVNFKEKIFGDCNLLATYEMLLSGGETECRLGDISTKDADVETGFMAVCSVRNLKITPAKMPDTVTAIESSEIPSDYRVLLQNPVLAAFRFMKAPHWADMNISGYSSQKLLDIAVDISDIRTVIDRNGEAVTTAEYRIKNSSRQFLAMQLPESSEPWSIKVDGESRRVSASEGKLLVPVPRKQDTDDPISIEVVYAQKYGELGSSRKLKFTAPALGLENMQTRWFLSVPDDYDIVSFAGNMETLRNPQLAGLPGLLRRTCGWFGEIFKTGLVIPWAMLTLGGLILAWSWGRKRLMILSTTVGICLVGAAFIISLAMLGRNIPVMPDISQTTPVSCGEFTRLFSVPQDVPQLEMEVINMRGWTAGKLLSLAAGIILFIVMSAGSFWFKVRLARALAVSVGAMFLLLGFSQWLTLNALAALILALLLPLLVTAVVWTRTFIAARRSFEKAAAAALAVMFILPFSGGAAEERIEVISADYTLTTQTTDKTVNLVAEGKFSISAEKIGEIPVLETPAVLTKGIPEDSDLEMVRSGANYLLKIKSKGNYDVAIGFLIPLNDEGDGSYNFNLKLPECLRNTVKINVDNKTMGVESQNSVFFKADIVNEQCTAMASFKGGTRALFRLVPQVRRIKEEKVVFFTNIDSLAKFAQGFVEISNNVNFQIAQGETAKFALEIPENMRVTAVEAANLGAWRYDQDKHLLEVFLTEARYGTFGMRIVTQIANCNLPYDVKLGILKVRDAGREHGTLGLGVDPSVQIQADKMEGMDVINTADFAAKFAMPEDMRLNLKKSFRYQSSPASVEVKALPVEPEIRVFENTRISYEEEKTLMVSDLDVEIAKCGIFSVTVEIPESFDIEKVFGEGIQHWDEITEQGPHRIAVHFERRMLGQTQIHLELIAMDKKREGQQTIPRLAVRNAQRLKGELNILVEHGIRMDVIERKGLEVKAEGFAGAQNRLSQSFSIVRPDWELKVAFDTISPWIQAEMLQVTKISEGIIETDAYLHYAVENAGIKIFRIRLPENAETPEFLGDNIAGYQKNKEGVWEVELNQKISARYALQCRFRQSFAKEEKVTVLPAVTEGTELQKGYLAVLSDDTLQVKFASGKGEITEFDPRKIPTTFKVEYERLSKAVVCFHTVGSDYAVTLDVIRHKTAEMLKAQIGAVEVNSYVSPEGRVITKAEITLNNGNENFVRISLPEGGTVWSVMIDGQPVDAAREGSELLVPLKQSISGGGRDQKLELTYSIQADKGWSVLKQTYKGLSISLPVRNLVWNLILPPGMEYKDFKGTLDWVDRSFLTFISSDIAQYDEKNRMEKDQSLAKAKGYVSAANKLVQAGKINEAYEAYQNAANFAQNDKELNSDIQGQWLQVQRDQSLVAFGNRRAQQKKGKGFEGASDNQPMPQAEQQAMPQQALQVKDINTLKQQLGSSETRTLQMISDKILLQQQAAAVSPHPLNPSIPEGGTKITFRRDLQVTPLAPMEVSFKAVRKFDWRQISGLTAAAVLTGILMLASMLAMALFPRKNAG